VSPPPLPPTTPPARPPARPFALRLDEPQGPLPFIPRADGAGEVIWEYTVDPIHHNPYGTLHGGVVMALMDSAMGHVVGAAVHAQGRFNAAAQMSVNFLAPVRAGTIRARARIVKLGKRLAVVEATAENEAGVTIATATAVHSLLP
jgi:uncharacterized protein (TIGR00369 family)